MSDQGDGQLELDAAMRTFGRSAVMIYRGAREDGSRVEAFWATAAVVLAIMKKDDE